MTKIPIKSVLFLLRCSSSENTAYTHRVLKLREGLIHHGIKADTYFIGDDPLTSHTMIPLYIFKIGKLIKKYDIVHAGAAPSAHVAVMSKLFTGTKIIYDMHGDRYQEILQEISLGMRAKHTLIKTFIQNFNATYGCNYYFPASGPLKELLIKRGVSKNKITVIRNGVDLDLFKATPIKQRNIKYVTYAGKFQAYQAIDHFVDAIQQIDDPNIRFRIIGFGPEDAKIKEKLFLNLKEKVELIDMVPQVSLIQYLQDSDILVIPRNASPVTKVALPTKFAEYIALARPVIVANVDETADFVREFNCGMVYEKGGLKDAILSLTSKSTEDAEKMGQNGRKLAEQLFAWPIIWKQYIDALNICTENN